LLGLAWLAGMGRNGDRAFVLIFFFGEGKVILFVPFSLFRYLLFASGLVGWAWLGRDIVNFRV
jgi:hypothetical protein